jgi:aerobic-type carbon monoxide dehydrogenase small subunit (CoxS/CutS family)
VIGSGERRDLALAVNGEPRTGTAEPRTTLVDFLRDELGLTGTHVGCEHGVCGACTVLLDGRSVRSCLVFALQAEGHEVTTVEGLADGDGSLGALQQAFHDRHALQCGFCTPGFLLASQELLERKPAPTEGEVRAGLSGNLCRCTGYQNIVEAVLLAARRRAEAGS